MNRDSPDLNAVVHKEEGKPAAGQLNPDWVEWLMGWPVGWTSLEPMSRESFDEWKRQTRSGEWFDAEPDGVPRVATGVPQRVSRLKAIGNGQVPACAAMAWGILTTTAAPSGAGDEEEGKSCVSV